MSFSVDHIVRYPVKGLPGQTLESVHVEAGKCLPFDRHWALAHSSSAVDPAAPDWAAKSNFLQLARDEKLGQLGAEFDEETQTLTITRKGRQVSRGQLSDHMGRTLIETFFAGFMPSGSRGNPRIVEAPGVQGFSDVQDTYISIINMASVRDIERVTRAPVHPARFRGNIYIEAEPAWVEMEWVGKRLAIGSAEFEVMEKIGRCAATNMNPEKGVVDMNIPLSLRKGFGHVICGIYAKAVKDGDIKPGDSVSPLS